MRDKEWREKEYLWVSEGVENLPLKSGLVVAVSEENGIISRSIFQSDFSYYFHYRWHNVSNIKVDNSSLFVYFPVSSIFDTYDSLVQVSEWVKFSVVPGTPSDVICLHVSCALIGWNVDLICTSVYEIDLWIKYMISDSVLFVPPFHLIFLYYG